MKSKVKKPKVTLEPSGNGGWFVRIDGKNVGFHQSHGIAAEFHKRVINYGRRMYQYGASKRTQQR